MSRIAATLKRYKAAERIRKRESVRKRKREQQRECGRRDRAQNAADPRVGRRLPDCG